MTDNRITTYEQAEVVSAHEHAAWWSDLTQRAVGIEAGPDDMVEEIARMTALSERLRRERPLLFHQAARTGVDVVELAAAAGISPSQVCAEWRTWADGQRQLFHDSMSSVGGGHAFGLDAEEYGTVETVLGVDGIIRDN